MIPLDVVESESFKDLKKYCTPSAKDFSRRTLTRRIYNKYVFIAALFKCSYFFATHLHSLSNVELFLKECGRLYNNI